MKLTANYNKTLETTSFTLAQFDYKKQLEQIFFHKQGEGISVYQRT